MNLADLEGRATVPFDEALPFYGVGRTTAYVLAKEGRLPGCRRLGGRYVVVVPALLEWLGARPQTDDAPGDQPGASSLLGHQPKETNGDGTPQP